MPKNSKFYASGEKYGYVLTDVVRCDPIVVDKKGIKVREVPYEFAIKPDSENDGIIQSYKEIRALSGGKLTLSEYNELKSEVLDEISYHYATIKEASEYPE